MGSILDAIMIPVGSADTILAGVIDSLTNAINQTNELIADLFSGSSA